MCFHAKVASPMAEKLQRVPIENASSPRGGCRRRSWSRSNWRSVIVIGSEKHGNRSLLWRAKLMSIWCAAIATMTRCTSGETGVLLRLRSRRTQPAWVFADSFADPSNDPSQFRCESMSRVKTRGKGNTKTKNKARGNQGLCKSVSKARSALLSDF